MGLDSMMSDVIVIHAFSDYDELGQAEEALDEAVCFLRGSWAAFV